MDPIGGLVVAGMIMKSGGSIFNASIKELMDKGMTVTQIDDVKAVVDQIQKKETDFLHYHSLRGRKQGPFHHVDMMLQVNPSLSTARVFQLQREIQSSIHKELPHVQQVHIFVEPTKTQESPSLEKGNI